MRSGGARPSPRNLLAKLARNCARRVAHGLFLYQKFLLQIWVTGLPDMIEKESMSRHRKDTGLLHGTSLATSLGIDVLDWRPCPENVPLLSSALRS